MFNIKRVITVPYSVEKMFFLVNNISVYSEFIPGCINSYILVHGNSELVAKIDIFWFGIYYSFITRNIIIKNQRIIIELIDGPCKSLFGYWKFMYLSQEISKIECNFFYELHTLLIEKIFNCVLQKVICDVMKSFIFRAREIYK